MLGHINSIIHEVQKEEGLELSGVSRMHIERLVMDAIDKSTAHLEKDLKYWQNFKLKKYFPEKNKRKRVGKNGICIRENV